MLPRLANKDVYNNAHKPRLRGRLVDKTIRGRAVNFGTACIGVGL